MAGLTLLVFLAFLALAWQGVGRPDWRLAFAWAWLLVLLSVLLLTEGLSLFGALAPVPVKIAWGALAVATGALALAHGRHSAREAPARPAPTPLAADERIVLLVIGALLAITLLIALVRPPNTWDSMTYHLARVAAWIQQGGVGFYFTTIDRQNYSMPLAEYAILHLQLLSGGDRYANLVQWFAYLASLVLVSLLIRELGGTRRWQCYGAAAAALLPMALLQSQSTQNDLPVSSLCLAFALGLLRLAGGVGADRVLFATLALGLALLAKGTAYPYTAGIGVALGLYVLARAASPGAAFARAGALALIVAGALALNAAHLGRNLQYYGHVLSTDVADDQMAGDRGAGALAANLAKNAALHLATPDERLNARLEGGLRAVLGERATTARDNLNGEPFRITFSLHEDTASNPLHFLLILATLLVAPFVARRTGPRALALLAGVLLGALVGAATVKWQPWGSRLHLPLFLLALPVGVAVLGAWGAGGRRVLAWFTLAAGLYAIPVLLFNPTGRLLAPAGEPLVFAGPREAGYFVARPQLYPQFRQAARLVETAGAEEVGLLLGPDDWDYPLRMLLGRHARPGVPRFVYLGEMPTGDSAPEMVVAMSPRPDEPAPGTGWRLLHDSPEIRLYRRVGSP